MKNYYKISEISKLYNIGPDSLRYYERLGILKPKRDTNGYRLYSLKELYKLNMIRDLRSLDFSMEQIKKYLEEQSVCNTLRLLHEEHLLLQTRIKELKKRKKIIRARIADLAALLTIPAGTFSIKECPRRPCVQLSEYITRDEEMDFLIKKLHKKHENKVYDFGTQTIGAFFSMEELNRGIPNVYTSVFFVLEQTAEQCDFVLPAGKYLSCHYRGNYEQNALRVRELLDYAEQKDLPLAGKPFEIYKIDNRDTVCPEEFLTEIQLLIDNSFFSQAEENNPL